MTTTEFLEFQVVVVVHEELAGGGDLFGGLFIILYKTVEPLGVAVLFGHHAHADVRAAQDVVLPDDGLGVPQDAQGVCMGEHNGQAVLVAQGPHGLGGHGADGGNLHGLIAHFGHLGQGVVQVLGGLGIRAQGKELGSYFHTFFLLWGFMPGPWPLFMLR